MTQNFKGKTVLITGAGWGVGAATALLYADCGANVIVSDTSLRGGKDTLAKIKSQKGNAAYIRTDVSSAAACEKLIKKAIEIFGSIDIACNNSAIFSYPLCLPDKSMQLFDNESIINLNGLHNCMLCEIEAMQQQGGGIIVNTSSIIGPIGLRSSTEYVDEKYGMAAPLPNFPGEYPTIHINTIAPTLIGRYGTIQEVAGLVLWLSSDKMPLLPTVFADNN